MACGAKRALAVAAAAVAAGRHFAARWAAYPTGDTASAPGDRSARSARPHRSGQRGRRRGGWRSTPGFRSARHDNRSASAPGRGSRRRIQDQQLKSKGPAAGLRLLGVALGFSQDAICSPSLSTSMLGPEHAGVLRPQSGSTSISRGQRALAQRLARTSRRPTASDPDWTSDRQQAGCQRQRTASTCRPRLQGIAASSSPRSAWNRSGLFRRLLPSAPAFISRLAGKQHGAHDNRRRPPAAASRRAPFPQPHPIVAGAGLCSCCLRCTPDAVDHGARGRILRSASSVHLAASPHTHPPAGRYPGSRRRRQQSGRC